MIGFRARHLGVVTSLAALLLVTACGSGPAAPTPATPVASPTPAVPADPGLAGRLARAADVDGAFAHLAALQGIADRNGGNRASGTPGHEQSVDYVADLLRRAGYQVTTPAFPIDGFAVDAQTLAVAGAPGPGVDALEYSPTTPPGGITAPLVVAREAPVDASPGCEAGDYADLPVRGAVVLVRRGVCPFTRKQQVAADAGAAAVLVANDVDGAVGGTLGSVREGRVPTGSVGRLDGDALAARAGTPVTLVLATRSSSVTTRSVIAQTTTGRPDEVVLAGAHLDSVPAGPGINDNGTGSAGQLEIALELGGAPPVTNAVRFAWWGGEESGLLGSTAYVAGLSPEQRRDIALVLNTDMIGSPNPAYLAYDGDDSDRTGAPPGPPGSDGIERTLSAALAAQGVPVRGTDFDGRSDYGPFIEARIPAGGLFTGAEELKTPDQAALWGGRAGVAYDPCYHQACDTLANVDRVAFDRNLRALASTVGTYATDLGGPNGVPARDRRPSG